MVDVDDEEEEESESLPDELPESVPVPDMSELSVDISPEAGRLAAVERKRYLWNWDGIYVLAAGRQLADTCADKY